jgi:hypothetical protein
MDELCRLSDFFRHNPLVTSRKLKISLYDFYSLQDFFRQGMPAREPECGEAG